MEEFIRNELLGNLEARKLKLSEFELIENEYEAIKTEFEAVETKLAEFEDFDKEKLLSEISELENYLFPKQNSEDDEAEENAVIEEEVL